jgi:hypothetical protein
MRGSVNDWLRVILSLPAARLEVGGPDDGQDASLEGTYRADLPAVLGTAISGKLVYTGQSGSIMHCSDGSWLLSW